VSDPLAGDPLLKGWRDMACGAGDDRSPATKDDAAALLDRLLAATALARRRGEALRRLALPVESLVANVINLHGHYEGNPHLCSQSVRQGLAALVLLAEEAKRALSDERDAT
jgi:hypothetical protein